MNTDRRETPAPPTLLLNVSSSDAPCRIDVYLTENLEEDLTRSRVQRLIRDGLVLVDGAAVKPGHAVRGGERIEISLPPTAEPAPEPEAIPLDILYEDDAIVVLNKEPGIVLHPGAGARSGTLVNALLHHCRGSLSGIGGTARPGIVHRLDRLTSGCLCVAKTDAAHRGLAAQLADRTMRRSYLAWVVGEMPEREGRIDAPIGRSRRDRTQMAVVHRGGRPAATRWEVLARAPGLTRLLCRLETGRTHQIRVHLAHIGFPVVGDPEYGLSKRDARMRIPPGHPTLIQALARVDRQLLHAWRLELIHPTTGEPMQFEAPLPDDFGSFDAAVGGRQ
ncbi:RluA family pseudouridine synthase [Candidatus Sumerlaeota bacterium]|nr:RluA family pseudouridine synthase [Candidatus Sumerlaeota bacterium]